MTFKRTLLLTLSGLIAFSAFSGCRATGDSSTSESSSSSSEPSNKKTYSVLQDEDWDPEILQSNGESLSAYKIIIPTAASASVEYAAQIMQDYIKQATNVVIPILTDSTSEGTHEILIGDTTRNEDSDIDFALLGQESFVVKSVGNDLVIAGNERGSLYGVYDYLEAIGYRFYTHDVTNIPADRQVFIAKNFERSWTPTFDFRDMLFYESNEHIVGKNTEITEWCVSQRINSNYMRSELKSNAKYGGTVGYIGGDGYMVHTARKLLPYSAATSISHPDWYAREDGVILLSGKDGYDTDLCWSNDEMLDYLYNQIIKTINNDSKSNVISLSMNDTSSYCKCETCTAQQAEYGVSGWFYRAINKIAVRLKVDKPNVKLDTIAYSYAIDAPDIVLEDNIIVRLCLSGCRWHTNAEECTELGGGLQKSFDVLQAWKSHAKEFYVWSYPINWANNLTFDASYQGLYNQYKYFAENNVKGIYCEGYPVNNGEFCELKTYMLAKLLANPTMSYGEYQYHMRDFMQGYYGEGWEFVLEYIDTMYDIIMQDMADKDYHLNMWYAYEENFPFTKYWDGVDHIYDDILDEIDSYWEDALELANGEQAKRIRKSRIHWKYLKLYNTFDNIKKYGTDEKKEALYAENKELYNDMMEAGVLQRNAESSTLDIITVFTRSPQTWWSR